MKNYALMYTDIVYIMYWIYSAVQCVQERNLKKIVCRLSTFVMHQQSVDMIDVQFCS